MSFSILLLERQKQADIWGSLTHQPCLLGEFQLSEKPFLTQKWMVP